jgi:hypothetical protein
MARPASTLKIVIHTSGVTKSLSRNTQTHEAHIATTAPHTTINCPQLNRSLMYAITVAKPPDTASPIALSGCTWVNVVVSRYL